jgi:hypothetical protein
LNAPYKIDRGDEDEIDADVVGSNLLDRFVLYLERGLYKPGSIYSRKGLNVSNQGFEGF